MNPAIDVSLLKKVYPQALTKTLAVHCTHLIDALDKFKIDNGPRMAAFFAQTGHETLDLLFLEERWGPTPQQLRYDKELATTLGNVNPGDGFKYRGRGLIHLTGLGNYKRCSEAIGHNLVMSPELGREPHVASKIAAWFWHDKKLNTLAENFDFDTITRKINGGLTGKADRDVRYIRALKALGVTHKGVA